ncbi:RNA-directed DNA polymerase, eukaryota [Tanacetum coccineum]
MEKIEDFCVKQCWGNSVFDYVYSEAVGNSGGILCVWDTNSFCKNSVTVSDYFVITRGKWRLTGKNMMIIGVYAPQEGKEKQALWDFLRFEVDKWNGDVIIMGDFNEVRVKSDRFGTHFNPHGAHRFNSFILDSGLVEVNLGGCRFTWCHRSATKMSKLDRFLVSESVISGSPNIKAVTLERFLSDHRPILLKENGYDYGPTPFRFFHHWLEMDGFNTFVENTWKNSPMVGNNALLSLMNKLRNLKNQIRIWNKSNSGTRKNDQLRLKKQLEEIDLDIDRGLGNEELVNSRLAILHQIQKIDNLESKERAQKAKIKWAVEGDENSGFFHGIINKRRNIQNIRGVMVDGNWIENPNDVKKEFFDHFANRFGKPDKPTASISLDFPNQISHEQSDHMEREVSNDEIKKSVWECGTDKAPGPDGFTFGFFRHFWHLVDRDVCEAVRYFFKFSDLPKGCNSSFIALIPKIPDANLVKDFRPISLIGSIYKIIAKILTNRLVDVLGGIINEVQSAFIKDRQILDGPFILNEVMSWCKKKKKQTLLFKVDFEKAYDSVRWDFLDDVLGKFGFGDKWRKWIQCCLHSSKGSIIINGSPTDEFQFGRGLKQGDPLSPFLFLLIMESLHISFQRVVDAGMFHGIDVGGLVNLSHMFYADDAVFIGEWSESNITSLIHVLDCFHKVSGLKINMCKSKIMGIEVDNGKVSRAATKFGCLVLKAPFLYLGSYVGGDMNKIQSWKDIIDRIRRRLSRWKMKMLSIGGRLMLIKSVLGSMPIFHMSMFKVPAGVIQILESLRSKFFNGHESSGKKASWVQWKKALAPKDNGGLGIFSLYALNRGLIFKWVWRFLAHEPTLWSRVIKAIHGANGKIDEISGKGANSCWINIIKEVRRLEEKGINLLLFMKKKLGNGLSTLFWDDVWCDGGKLKNRFPRAYALENSKQITVGQKLAHPSLYHSFRRHPRGGLELTQVEELAKVINPVVLTQSPDSWSWTLNNSGGYTVASSRNMIDSRLLPKGDLKTRWIRYVPNKVNTFAWKVMTNSLPTRFNISRRGIDIESLSCVNCDVGIETNDHLFFACNTAKKISKLINRWWDVPFMDINSYGEWRSWIDNVKLPKKNKSMFQVLITGVGIDAILCLAGTIGIDLMSAPIVEEEIVEPAGEDSFDSYDTKDGIVRSFEVILIDLNDVVRDFYHHMSEATRVWSGSFRRIPRGGIEQNQFDSLVELVRSVTIVPSADRWNWNLESTGIFSVASARRRIDEICLPNIGEETRWVKCVPIKINVLAWKIKTDALPTRFNISRRGIDIQDMSCPICDNAIESTDHLFFRCGLVRDIANKVLSWWNLDHANLNSYAEWKSWLVSIRMDSKLKKMFEGVCSEMLIQKTFENGAHSYSGAMAQAIAPESAATSAKVLWHQNCYDTTFRCLTRWLKP